MLNLIPRPLHCAVESTVTLLLLIVSKRLLDALRQQLLAHEERFPPSALELNLEFNDAALQPRAALSCATSIRFASTGQAHVQWCLLRASAA
jgi:hypothetical protein